MLRNFLSITVLLLFAGASNAASIMVDADAQQYRAGDTITISVSYTVQAGDVLAGFDALAVQVGWDPALAFVRNAGTTSANGNSSQTPILTGLTGSPTPTCANSRDVCTIITQSTFSPVNFAAVATVTGQLILEAIGPIPNVPTSLGLTVTSFSGPATAADLTVGVNFQNASVPEPATTALLAFGVAAAAWRRRSR